MKRLVSLTAIFLMLWLSAIDVAAQTRARQRGGGGGTSRRITSGHRSGGRMEREMTGQLNAGAGRVADQIKNLTRFLYLLGGIAKDINAVDEAARRGDASPAAIEQTKRSKATLTASLQNVRAGLDALEIDFRTQPALQPYYIKLAGVAQGAVNAENQAAAGQFDNAGRSMLAVVNKLTDVLLVMQQTR